MDDNQPVPLSELWNTVYCNRHQEINETTDLLQELQDAIASGKLTFPHSPSCMSACDNLTMESNELSDVRIELPGNSFLCTATFVPLTYSQCKMSQLHNHDPSKPWCLHPIQHIPGHQKKYVDFFQRDHVLMLSATLHHRVAFQLTAPSILETSEEGCSVVGQRTWCSKYSITLCS